MQFTTPLALLFLAVSTSASTVSFAQRRIDYVSIANEYRARFGLPLFSFDPQLEANADNTVFEGHGQMIHKLNPGTFGQVLAPGNLDNFRNIYMGGWLCEIVWQGMEDECARESQGWDHAGQTGHAEILTNPDYHRIGCASQFGITGCDFGF